MFPTMFEKDKENGKYTLCKNSTTRLKNKEMKLKNL